MRSGTSQSGRECQWDDNRVSIDFSDFIQAEVLELPWTAELAHSRWGEVMVKEEKRLDQLAINIALSSMVNPLREDFG